MVTSDIQHYNKAIKGQGCVYEDILVAYLAIFICILTKLLLLTHRVRERDYLARFCIGRKTEIVMKLGANCRVY